MHVSVLPYIYKIYERPIYEHLMDFLETQFHHLLSAFRPGLDAKQHIKQNNGRLEKSSGAVFSEVS